MALQAIGLPQHIPGLVNTTTAAPALTTLATLDAAGEFQAWIFQATEDMVISHVLWRTGAVSGAPTADTRIETVAADGTPSGTLWAANTNIVSGALSATTTALHALTASASITKGQFFCVKVVYASGTSFVVQHGANIQRFISALPYLATNTTGSTVLARQAGLNCLGLGSSATAFYKLENCIPASAVTGVAFNNTTSFARGVRFQVPFKCRILGFSWYNNLAIGDYKPIFTDDAGVSLIGTNATIDGNFNAASTGSLSVIFDTSVDLAINTWYRAAIEPQSATNQTWYYLSTPSADYVTANWMGAFWQRAERVSGTWTDTPTDFPIMDLILSHLDDAVASGVTAHVIGG